MNKRGIGPFILLFVLAFVMVAYQVSLNPEINAEKVKDSISFNQTEVNMSQMPELGDAIESVTNGILGFIEAMTKFSIQLAVDNPDLPYGMILFVVVLTLIVPLIWTAFKIFLIVFFLAREYLIKRKENKERRQLEWRNQVRKI